MSRPPANAAEARGLIERIVRSNGFVSESSLETMSQEVRREVEEALLAKDKKIGSSVLTLAKNLYTSKARFVFELLQNTDDNNYTAAQAAGQEPSVSFTLYPDKLVVDCNEDGFTEENLSAICDVGNSSKSGSQGYIGEKGIGFKSVFMAAWKVHIQSGHLSFSFVHRRGDSGMGMVKPIWEEPAGALPRENYTRITLFLHEGGDAEQTRREREDVREQFRELEPALLLFVRKLRCVNVTFCNGQGRQTWATSLTRHQAAETDRAVLEKRTADGGSVRDVAPERHIYHVTEHTATNVARHDNRELSASDRSSPASRQSKIVLAFPVSAESVPIIEAQKAFAFLPMKQMGFNFLIQADFVTQANREDIVTTSARNQDLIKGVIDAFISTVLQFCQHDALQYTWMRYLPREGTHHWDPFWMKLVDGIKERLKSEFIIRTREKGILRRLADVKDRAADTNDQYGDPLLQDLVSEMYLSDSYARADINTLRDFGLENISMDKVIELVRQDLVQSDSGSRIKSPSTDDDWQTRFSRLITLPWRKGWGDIQSEVRSLPIIPLVDGSWAKAVDGDCFYRSVSNIKIPQDLGLRIVGAKLARNAARRELFDKLGVQKASTTMIRSRILDMYSRSDMSNVSFERSLEHLKFLYLTHELRQDCERRPKLFIHDHLGQPRKPLEYDLYVQDQHPYGAHELLGPRTMSSFNVFFVNPRYLNDVPKTPSGMALSWVEWMYQEVGLARNIRLADRDGKVLSKECRYIAECHGDKFLEFLRHVWPEQGQYIEDKKSILAELKKTPVVCTNGTRVALSTCYMPLRTLRAFQSRFTDADLLPFLDISSSNDTDLLTKWSFLTNIVAVSCDNDLRFHTDLLTAFVGAARDSMTEADALKLFDLYKCIGAHCMGSEDPGRMKERVREYFNESFAILAPQSEGVLGDIWWIELGACLWEAPLYLETMFPLKALYENAGLDTRLDDMQRFFQGTLGVPDIGPTGVIEELKYMREEGNGQNISELYRLLQKMHDADNSISGALRDAFEKSSLVYVERGESSGWYSPSQCLWSSTTSIDGKIAIDKQYAEFETLFTQVLGVSRVTLAMVYEELLGVASNGATTEEIKKLLLVFSALLEAEGSRPTPERLLKRRVFPVVSPGGGAVALCSGETEFFIVDRDDVFAAFGSRVRHLDFSLKDVCHLGPFIAWAGLESRRLSRSAEEVSRVEGGVERPIRDPDRNVKRKAYAFLRIAAGYRSPKFAVDPQGLYDTLRTAETVETEGISSTLVLHQDGNTYEHEVNKSQLHIEERDGSLKIYVPRDKEAFGACVYDTLPLRLLSWIMASPGSTEAHPGVIKNLDTAVAVSILTCEFDAVSMILERNGVPKVNDVLEVPEEVFEAASPPATPVRRNTTSARSPGEASSAAVTPDRFFPSPDNGDAGYATPLTDPGDYGFDSGARAAIRSPDSRFRLAESKPLGETYARLLNSAVTVAERMAKRDYGSVDIANVALDNLSLQDDDVFSGNSLRNDLSAMQGQHVKIGAAGELFVFVLLSSLDPELTGFGRDNWQSTIRHHATAHHSFADLIRWTGRETSDIVYDDDCGNLTQLLIAKGHLSQVWKQKTPRYYIEVKSTLDRCETPFYVSHGQAERMRKSTNGPSGCENQDAIYVIFRVFNLGTESTGVRIYVDPEEQRRTGKLTFKTDATYAVTPGEVSLAGLSSSKG